MSLLLALAALPLAQAASTQDAPERAVAMATQLCEPFLAGRLAKDDAAEAAVAMGLKRLSRPGADFVFLMAGDLALAMSGEGDARDCSVPVDRISLAQLVAPLRAAASRAKWPELANGAKSHLWLTPSHLMAAIDETYDKPETAIAIRFQKRGLPPQVGGKPADPLGLVMAQICLPYAQRVIDADGARDLAVAAGLAARDAAYAGYDLELSFGEIASARRCTVTAPATGAAVRKRLAEWQGPGRSVRVSGQAVVVASIPAN